jgi:parallel beta-helix repeat protein
MRNRLLSIIFILLIIFNIIIIYTPENITKGTNVSGTQTGLWNLAGSPYIVTDDVVVPQGEFLDIRPGVQVRFQLDTQFMVRGMLFANGTAGQKITFTSDLAAPFIYTWSGVRFRGVGTGLMENCSISWAKRGIDAKLTTRFRIKNSEIFKCANGTRFNTVSVSSVENCVIHDNLIHGFHSKWGMGLIRVMNNTFYNNAKGISFSFTWASLISNNTLYSNMRGIRLRHTFNCLIINNTIKNTTYPRPIPGKWQGTHFGIQMNRSSSNILVNNTIIDTLGYGIKIKTSSNNTFYNNYIENSSDYGIYIFNLCTKNRFINNTIINITSSAIRLETSSSGNYFRNNVITKDVNEYAVDYDLDSIWNWFITNTVNNKPLRIYFNESGSFITSELTGKSITEPKMTNIGQVVIIDSSDFRIHTGSFYDGNAGIFLYNVHNGIIENSTIINMEDYGIYFGYNSTNITVINSTLTISVAAFGYFYLGEYSNITVLNTTFDQSKVILKEASNLTIKWYMHVRVYSPLDQPVSGALVTLRDRFGTVV